MFNNIIKPLTVVPCNDSNSSNGEKPYDGTKCTIYVASSANLDVLEQLLTFNLNEPTEIVLGNGASPLDFMIENCLTTMTAGEARTVHFRAPNKTELQVPLSNDVIELTLELQLTLSSMDDSVIPLWKMSYSQLVLRSSQLKSEGIDFFKRNKIIWAFWKFSKAIKLLVISSSCPDKPNLGDELEATARNLRISLHLNVAACQLRCTQYEHVVDNCTKVLRLDEANLKAFFRRGTALIHLQEYERATSDLRKVLALEPGNKAAAQQMTILKQKIQDHDKYLSKALQNMFS